MCITSRQVDPINCIAFHGLGSHVQRIKAGFVLEMGEFCKDEEHSAKIMKGFFGQGRNTMEGLFLHNVVYEVMKMRGAILF